MGKNKNINKTPKQHYMLVMGRDAKGRYYAECHEKLSGIFKEEEENLGMCADADGITWNRVSDTPGFILESTKDEDDDMETATDAAAGIILMSILYLAKKDTDRPNFEYTKYAGSNLLKNENFVEYNLIDISERLEEAMDEVMESEKKFFNMDDLFNKNGEFYRQCVDFVASEQIEIIHKQLDDRFSVLRATVKGTGSNRTVSFSGRTGDELISCSLSVKREYQEVFQKIASIDVIRHIVFNRMIPEFGELLDMFPNRPSYSVGIEFVEAEDSNETQPFAPIAVPGYSSEKTRFS